MSAFALRLAVLPSVLLLLFVVRRNKNSRDPMSLLVWLAVLGAVSTIPAVVVELVGGVLLYYMGLESGTAVYELVNCFFIVAMIEELGKFLGMLILTWKIRTLTTAMTALYMACARRSDLQHWRISCMYSRVE